MFAGYSMVAKGLICALCGLGGTFLVLLLVFLTVKGLQKLR